MDYTTYGVLHGDKISFTKAVTADTRRQAALDRNALLANGCVKAITYCGARVLIQEKVAPVN